MLCVVWTVSFKTDMIDRNYSLLFLDDWITILHQIRDVVCCGFQYSCLVISPEYLGWNLVLVLELFNFSQKLPTKP